MRFSPLLALAASLFIAACGGSEDPAKASDSATSAQSGSGGGGGSTSGAGGGGGQAASKLAPDPAFIPVATGACPDFTEGKHTFSPDALTREVEIWAGDDPKAQDGPLIFFWHGAGGSPTEAPLVFGSKVMSAIKAAGGIVAAPYHDDTAGFLPWFLALSGGTRYDDLRVADEVLACAIEKAGVDLRRIHSVGFSAGAMNTMQFSILRSGYLASIVTYSGAQMGVLENQDPTNLYPAMLFHGGPTDEVLIKFQGTTEKFQSELSAAGHFSFICDHGGGHTVPTDGRDSAFQFLQDHPFGTNPSPYAAGLPESFPSYCSL